MVITALKKSAEWSSAWFRFDKPCVLIAALPARIDLDGHTHLPIDSALPNACGLKRFTCIQRETSIWLELQVSDGLVIKKQIGVYECNVLACCTIHQVSSILFLFSFGGLFLCLLEDRAKSSVSMSNLIIKMSAFLPFGWLKKWLMSRRLVKHDTSTLNN